MSKELNTVSELLRSRNFSGVIGRSGSKVKINYKRNVINK